MKEYSDTALELDNIFHNDNWKNNLISSRYDYKLIQERLNDLQNAKSSGDYKKLLSLLRAGMLRNFGGISNKKLYNRTYIGTKILIERYNIEIEKCLKWIDENNQIDNQLKLDFYHDAKTTLGTTALCLHGGSLFGLCHIGIIKSLIGCKILPNVVVGSGIGAVVGSLICCLEEDDLIEILANLQSEIVNNKLQSLQDNEKFDKSQLYTSWVDNLKKGLTEELKLFIKFTLDKINEITFKEAYERTGKIFNILVYPTSNKIPNLLNYLSTPYITIHSAIHCSLGTGTLDENGNHKDIKLMIDYKNVVTEYSEIKCDFQPPYQVNGDSIELKNSPYDRITELFNVNQFIISISRPYLAPFLHSDWKIIYNNPPIIKKLWILINLEFKHRIRMLNRMGLLTTLMQWLLIDEKNVLVDTNHISVIPTGSNWIVWDVLDLFNQNNSTIDYWTGCGERSIWSIQSLLETRCRTEYLLNSYFEKYRKIN